MFIPGKVTFIMNKLVVISLVALYDYKLLAVRKNNGVLVPKNSPVIHPVMTCSVDRGLQKC